MTDIPDEIRISEDGTTVPVIELLTGRGFVTGKSGSGKSNTASVVAEELLELDLPLLIVDTDGEYYGLKERYELLHVGASELCDVQVTPAHAERIATLALEENVPVILDVSEYLDVDEARDLIHGVVRTLFIREKRLKKPFLLLVEEVHEYLPESGGLDEVGEILLQVAKRGRKRGLGLCGISQRPAAVDKDLITQCDWLIWHRLTWENDTKVVGRFLDDEYATAVEGLDDGEAIVVTDWDEQVNRVQFRRKKTFDAGATPGLEDVERPEFRTISTDLEAELEQIDPTANIGDPPTGGDDASESDTGSTGFDGVTVQVGTEEVDDADTDATLESGRTAEAELEVVDTPATGSGSTVPARSRTDGDTPARRGRARHGESHPVPGRRRRSRRRRDVAEENLVLEASHLVAYGVESTLWRVRRGVRRVGRAVGRASGKSMRRVRGDVSGLDPDYDPRLFAAVILGSAALGVGLLLLAVVG